MDSLYGRFRQNTFSEVFPDAETFTSEFNSNALFGSTSYDPNFITNTAATAGKRFNANLIYFLLYSNYANSVIASSDLNRFKYRMWSLIYQYGPTWAKEMDIQDKLRSLSEDEILTGTKTVSNNAMNPATDPVETDGVLSYINNQNTNKFTKSKIDGYQSLWSAIVSDPTQSFINKFKDLFLAIIMPEKPLLYEEVDDE